MEFRQGKNESKEQYLKRLFNTGNRSIKNIENTFAEMKEKGITICNECGCNIYQNKKHKC